MILFSITLISFFSIARYDNHFGNSDPWDQYRLLGPGFVFSLYLVILNWNERSWLKSILYFFILSATYFAALITGMTSWGMTVPFAGGIGALIVKLLFIDKSLEKNARLYFISGFVAGLAGLILYYVLAKTIKVEGIRFGMIVSIWQMTIGFLLLIQKQHEKPEANLT